MLIPNFTLRWMLGMIVVMAVVFLIMSRALAGSVWAAGVSAAILTLALAGLVYAVLFAIVWLFGLAGSMVAKSRPAARRRGE
ncbi:MAG TPA: hypothetical protein VHY20_06775 [Pirellulales bacterium]|jgi:hypothetical protein|nr:hypothetical protein [Pirellulales bacterium]